MIEKLLLATFGEGATPVGIRFVVLLMPATVLLVGLAKHVAVVAQPLQLFGPYVPFALLAILAITAAALIDFVVGFGSRLLGFFIGWWLADKTEIFPLHKQAFWRKCVSQYLGVAFIPDSDVRLIHDDQEHGRAVARAKADGDLNRWELLDKMSDADFEWKQIRFALDRVFPTPTGFDGTASTLHGAALDSVVAALFVLPFNPGIPAVAYVGLSAVLIGTYLFLLAIAHGIAKEQQYGAAQVAGLIRHIAEANERIGRANGTVTAAK